MAKISHLPSCVKLLQCWISHASPEVLRHIYEAGFAKFSLVQPKPVSENLTGEFMEPVAEKKRRGRPKGTGKQLTPSQRAINSRKEREAAGYKRVEIWLTPFEALRLSNAKANGLPWFNRHPDELKHIIDECTKVNNERRKQLSAIAKQIEGIKQQLETYRENGQAPDGPPLTEIVAQLEELRADVEILQGDEQDAYDALPDGLQMSSRGEDMQEAADDLDGAVSSLDEAIKKILSAIGQ